VNNPIQALKERTRQKLLADFGAFARRAWREVEPSKELLWSWHHELVAEHLMQCYRGETTRLIITQPPRSLKSKLVSVLFPAFVWAQSPGESFILCSYSDSLSEELNMARRRLLQSEWFQSTFPGKVLFSPDENRREQYKNLAGGQAIATSTDGTLTGKGGDYLLVDDLLSPQQSFSDLERQNANRFFDSTLRSRLNQPATGRIIVICQRLHEADLPGHLLESEPGIWTTLNLAMESEQDEEIVFPISGKVLQRKTGDLLHPARWSKAWVEKQKRTLGRIVWSGQYQQRPSPIEGNIVKVADIKFYGGKDLTTGEMDAQLPAAFERTIISCDTTFKDKSTSDYVCILVIGIVGARRFVRHIVNARMDLDSTENEIRNCHANYGPVSAVLIEDKSNGPAVIAHLTENLSGVIAINPMGGKVSRMMAAAPEFQSHGWFFDRTGAWTSKAIDQLCNFPNSKNDDIADAVSQAAIWLQSNTYELGLLDYAKKVSAEIAAGIRDAFGRRLNPKPVPVAVISPKSVHARVDGYAASRKNNDPCPAVGCGSTLTVVLSGHLHCNACGADDGVLPPKPIGGDICPVEDCGRRMFWSGGSLRCTNHGQPPIPMGNLRPMTTNGASRSAFAADNTVDSKIAQSFGKFW
jgi:predicted phage terminase large subunit-like protein